MTQPINDAYDEHIRAEALNHISKTRATTKRRVMLVTVLLLVNIGLAVAFAKVGSGWQAQALPTVFVISAIINAMTLKSAIQTLTLLRSQEYYINYFKTPE